MQEGGRAAAPPDARGGNRGGARCRCPVLAPAGPPTLELRPSRAVRGLHGAQGDSRRRRLLKAHVATQPQARRSSGVVGRQRWWGARLPTCPRPAGMCPCSSACPKPHQTRAGRKGRTRWATPRPAGPRWAEGAGGDEQPRELGRRLQAAPAPGSHIRLLFTPRGAPQTAGAAPGEPARLAFSALRPAPALLFPRHPAHATHRPYPSSRSAEPSGPLSAPPLDSAPSPAAARAAPRPYALP